MAQKKYTRPVLISKEELERRLMKANEELAVTNEKLLISNRDLEIANQKLISQARQRQEFYTNISHDIRAPLTALASTISLLREKKELDGEEYEQLLNVMCRRMDHLQAMLDELSLLGQMENPDLVLKKKAVPVVYFLEEFFYSCKENSQYAMRCLELELQLSEEVFFHVDADKLVRVLDNLFVNALRYSDDGDKIILGAELVDFENTSRIHIFVKDTGHGIRGEALEHIFERSFRGDEARSPKQTGLGLGLAIAKNIIEKHGGTITCESEYGQGSCFHIWLKNEK